MWYTLIEQLSQNISSTCRGDNVVIKYTTTTTTSTTEFLTPLGVTFDWVSQFSYACPVPSVVHTCPQTMCFCGLVRCIVQTWLLQQRIAGNGDRLQKDLGFRREKSQNKGRKFACKGRNWIRTGLISPMCWHPFIGYRSGSESFTKFNQLPTKLFPQNQYHICRASYKIIFQADRFVLLPATWFVNTTPKLQVREVLVRLPLMSGTTYLTLYDLAALLPHLKITWRLFCTIRHLPPDSSTIHCAQ